MRQSTFIKHKNSPAIDAFDFEVIQIDPPRISSVIAKRFALVKYMTSNKSGNFIAENGAKVVLDDISQLVDIIMGLCWEVRLEHVLKFLLRMMFD